MAIVKLIVDLKSSDYITSNPTKILEEDEVIFFNDGRYSFGDGVTELQDLVLFGGSVNSSSRLISGGGITVVTDDITIAEATYFISGFGTYVAPQGQFNNITLSSSGTQRFVAFYGKTDSTIVKVEGSEGAVASMPAEPVNSVLINYSLVTDGAIGPGVDLSGYLLRSDKATASEAQTGTNDTKYITPLSSIGVRLPRVNTVASSATPTINVDLYDIFYFSAQAHNITSITVTGTLTPFRPIILVFLDNGVARTITRGSSFVAVGETMVTTTTANKITTEAYLYYPSKSKLGCVGVKTEA